VANTFVYLTGKVSWVKHIKPDDKFGPPGKWSFKLHPDEKSLGIINDLKITKDGIGGIKNVLGKDEDGYFMTFSRPVNKTINGAVRAFYPPEVVNADGSPCTAAIGNGSDATAKIEVYTHRVPNGGKARATRWDSMRIDHLVPYEKERDYPPAELKKIEELANQPVPKW
jgi:hypothetical protein